MISTFTIKWHKNFEYKTLYTKFWLDYHCITNYYLLCDFNLGNNVCPWFFVSSFLSHIRNVRQLISFITVLIAVLPPVFYLIYPLPPEIRYLAYAFQQHRFQLQFNI
jgi:hypothetical protein